MQEWIRHKVDSFNSSWSIFWLFCFFLVLPIWLVDYPPMVDLPGHASQIQLMHNLRSEDFLYTDLFQRYYMTPYWGGYIPIYLLSFVFGVLTALKIMISLALVGFPYFIKKISEHFGGNPAWIWLCFPVAYSSPFYWGFLNYIFTVAIGLGWVYFCIKSSDSDGISWQSQLVIAVGVVVLFFGHLIVCGMLGLFVATYYLFLKKTYKQRISLLTPLLIFIPLVGAYFWWGTDNDGVARGLPSQFLLDYHPDRYKQSLSLLLGRNTWWTGMAGLMLLVTPFLTGGVLMRGLSRLLPLLIVLLFVLLLPRQMGGTYLVYPRFFVFVIPLLLFALEYRPSISNMLRNMLPILIASIVMSLNTWDIMKFGVEQEDYNKVIEQAAPDGRIRKIVFNPTSTAGDFMLPVYDHFPSWHHLRGKGLVEFNFAGFGRMPVSYKNADLTKKPRYGFNWEVHRGDCYDYFISRANVDPFYSPYSALGMYKNKVELVTSSGMWFLHRNKNPIVCN